MSIYQAEEGNGECQPAARLGVSGQWKSCDTHTGCSVRWAIGVEFLLRRSAGIHSEAKTKRWDKGANRRSYLLLKTLRPDRAGNLFIFLLQLNVEQANLNPILWKKCILRRCKIIKINNMSIEMEPLSHLQPSVLILNSDIFSQPDNTFENWSSKLGPSASGKVCFPFGCVHTERDNKLIYWQKYQYAHHYRLHVFTSML